MVLKVLWFQTPPLKFLGKHGQTLGLFVKLWVCNTAACVLNMFTSRDYAAELPLSPASFSSTLTFCYFKWYGNE